MPGRAAGNRLHGGIHPAADSGDEDELTHKVIFTCVNCYGFRVMILSIYEQLLTETMQAN